jgi:hypothetical protein
MGTTTTAEQVTIGDTVYEVLPPFHYKGMSFESGMPGCPTRFDYTFWDTGVRGAAVNTVSFYDTLENVATKAVARGVLRAVGPRPLTLRERVEKILTEWTPTTWQEGVDIRDELCKALNETR